MVAIHYSYLISSSNIFHCTADLNLLSWGGSNTLAVGLSQTVYLWDAATAGINELMTLDAGINDYVSSVSWIQQGGSHIAVGTAESGVQLWDVTAQKYVLFSVQNFFSILA